MNIGISKDDQASLAKGLTAFLAETYGLYLKTHYFHWNVTGKMFVTLHALFETQYNDLWTATDEIAERIRALGAFVPAHFAKESSITIGVEIPTAMEMVNELAEGHEAIARSARTLLSRAQKAGDEGTAGLLTDRMTVHEKTAWMLRSLSA